MASVMDFSRVMDFSGKCVLVTGGSRGIGRAVAGPEEVAQAVLFLAAEGSEFMTGAIIEVNGASYLRS